MYCQNCGTKIDNAAARFCPSCGSKVAAGQTAETAEEELVLQTNELETEVDASNLEHSRSTLRKSNRLVWPIIIPVVSLLIAGGSAYAYYHHQVETNKEVLFLKDKAENDALKGKYTDALASLKNANALRPAYQVLQKDQEQINTAIAFNRSLTEISNSLKTQKLDQADSQISKLKASLEKWSGPLFSPFQKQIEEKATTLAVAKIKVEINSLKTVDKLADKLTALSSLRAAETDAVKGLILAKIVDLTTKDAEAELHEKQFSDAMSTVDNGLKYASNDTKLVSFKKRIKNEQASFEKAEQQRIEKAMEVAAQEDLSNHTAAVSVNNLNFYTDDYGDLHISGDIVNQATVPISSVTLYYSIYDTSGNILASDSMYVDPYYLEPGENGTFEDFYYGVNEDTTVTVTKMTWQLN